MSDNTFDWRAILDGLTDEQRDILSSMVQHADGFPICKEGVCPQSCPFIAVDCVKHKMAELCRRAVDEATKEHAEEVRLLMVVLERNVAVSREATAWRAKEIMAPITKLIEQRDCLLKAAKKVLFNIKEPCRLDHHGYCQTHFIENPCSVAELNDAIRKAGGK
jgi:hypothetical protein